MRTLIVAACLVSLTMASASRGQAPEPQGAEEHHHFPMIEHRVTSWGRTVGNLTITADGLMVRRDFDFDTGKETAAKRTQLDPDAHRDAIAALEVLRTTSQSPAYCSGAPTDGPSGEFRWDGGQTYRIYYPCSSQFPELRAAEERFWAIVSKAEQSQSQSGD